MNSNLIISSAFSIILSAVVGFVIWKIQSKSVAKALALKEEAENKAKVIAKEKEKIEEGHQDVLNRLKELEDKGMSASHTLAALEKDMLPIAEAMKRKMIEVLTHPSDVFKIPDELLAKVKEIGAPMPPELLPILKERETSTNPHVTEQERLAAEALPILVRLAELEAKEDLHAEVTSVQLVSSTVKSTETKREEEGM